MVDMYLVGGAVRDKFLGVKSKDLDFAVEAPSFHAMLEWLKQEWSVQFYQVKPEFGTARGVFPRGLAAEWAGFRLSGVAADFVLCRKDGEYTDGRHPDRTEVGTIIDDLSRRDFTVNAIAQTWNGDFIDPFDGLTDLRQLRLRAVGDPVARLEEDALRAFRAIRFAVTKDLEPDYPLTRAMRRQRVLDKLPSVSVERVRDEMLRTFEYDTLAAIDWYRSFDGVYMEYAIKQGLWLKPTLEERR